MVLGVVELLLVGDTEFDAGELGVDVVLRLVCLVFVVEGDFEFVVGELGGEVGVTRFVCLVLVVEGELGFDAEPVWSSFLVAVVFLVGDEGWSKGFVGELTLVVCLFGLLVFGTFVVGEGWSKGFDVAAA